MGNRRIGRKRLYGVEKKGQKVVPAAGDGIKAALARTTQHRQGQEMITEILVDLGTTAGDVKGGGTAKIIGIGTDAAYITQLTEAKYGIITEIRAVVLESILDSGDTAVEVDLITSDNSDLALTDAQAGNQTVLCDGLSTKGEDITAVDTDFHANMQDSDPAYLYIANGDSDSNTNSLDAGKLAIYINGFAAPSDL